MHDKAEASEPIKHRLAVDGIGLNKNVDHVLDAVPSILLGVWPEVEEVVANEPNRTRAPAPVSVCARRHSATVVTAITAITNSLCSPRFKTALKRCASWGRISLDSGTIQMTSAGTC
jgi:hypothetical protein